MQDNENQDYISAHKFSTSHKDKLQNDKKCGCFYCLKIFDPKEITEWIEEEDGNSTALCPYCMVDSIIGESCGFEITETLLSNMKNYWFSDLDKIDEEINIQP